MHVQPLNSEDAHSLDKFIENHVYGSIEQIWAWGELQTQIPGRPDFRVFGVYKGEDLIGSMLVIRQEMGHGKTWLWCPRGPLLPMVDEAEKNAAWSLLQEACRNWARLHGDVFLRVEPSFLKGDFDLGGRRARESYMPGDTLVLDLQKSKEELLAQMTQKGRYNIKVAEKHGVKVERAKMADLSAFYEILKETGARDGFGVHQKSFYEAFLERLPSRAALYLARVKDEPVGGLLATFCGDTATYYFGASAARHRETMAPYALQWQAILDAKKEGYLRYDFLGIAPEGEEGHPLSGVTQFKTRFGGERVTYEKARIFVYRRVWWLLYGLGKKLRALQKG
jgi:lipid II:glycine glycyltransferase (peptidoglycan interpeptide bridge formation enzyme)